MSVAVYVRVSTDRQNLSSQKNEIQRWLDGNGIADAVWYEDKATGNNTDRDAFKELQKAVFNGEVKTIIVFKLDRLSRSLRDGITILTDWIEKGVRIVSTSQQLDFSGATGRMVAGVLFAVAEMEQETRRERQRAGIDAAKKAGVYFGRKKGTTKHNPQRAKELRDKGLTIPEIAKYLGVSKTTISNYFAQLKRQS